MSNNQFCPIWGNKAVRRLLQNPSEWEIDSPRIGQYKIPLDIAFPTNFDDSFKVRLTTWVVNQNHYGVKWPLINHDVLKNIELQRPIAIHERADRLLKFIASKCNRLGQQFNFYPKIESTDEIDNFKMLAVSESHDKEELTYLLNFLEESKLLDQLGTNNNRLDYVITPIGYAHLASLENKTPKSHQAFVAMWFNQSMNDAYEKGLAAGIRKAGYEPLKIDNKEHNNKIDDEIIAEIRRSRFLVADFTQGKEGARGGVYYEAGFAHGLNLPVIFPCKKESINQVHFDTRQYNHIEWNDPTELRDKLAQRISATIGDGPLKIIDTNF